jgi:hypothetical protein
VPDDVQRQFTTCLISQAQIGSYSSSDGGMSALRLMSQCQDQWQAYIDACTKVGTDGSVCSGTAAVMAQMSLKENGK